MIPWRSYVLSPPLQEEFHASTFSYRILTNLVCKKSKQQLKQFRLFENIWVPLDLKIPRQTLSNMFVHLYICMSVHLNIYVHIYICSSINICIYTYVCPSVYMYDCPSVHIYICPSVSPYIYWFVCLCICQYAFLSVCPFVYISIQLSAYLFACVILSAWLHACVRGFHLTVCQPASLSVCLSDSCLSIFDKRFFRL